MRGSYGCDAEGAGGAEPPAHGAGAVGHVAEAVGHVAEAGPPLGAGAPVGSPAETACAGEAGGVPPV